MATPADVLTRARDPHNDPVLPDETDGVRYLNAELLRYAAAGIQRAVELRPDLLFGRYLVGVKESYVTTDAFPLKPSLVQTIADYVVFRAETKDDEHVNSQRAIQFLQVFDKDVMA